MRYSFIIPVYNRPEEVDELLNSLTRQTNKNFEVLVVEDGSSVPCKEVVDNYADRLDICYYFKSNSGPGQTRNYGAERGHGEYLIILDSDCILPEGSFLALKLIKLILTVCHQQTLLDAFRLQIRYLV